MTALERGELPLQKVKTDMHQLIRESLKCISVQIEHAQGILKPELTAEHAFVMGDKAYLANALCNLLDNAIKYSPEKPELSVITRNSGRYLLIAVSDKGIGIPKEYHKKVFETFFRVPTGDVHDVKGFGMGLAYVKKIVELHEGYLELQSETGKGTTVILAIPYV
jgi:two-component system phosphate regulon sensor histidine kinase PhoR